MKPIAWTIVLGVALPAVAWASPQQADDGIVTIRKKASTWSFKVFPETRRKLVIEEKEVETDVPKQLHAIWAIDDAYAPLRNLASVFTITDGSAESRVVHFFAQGKQYEEWKEEPAQLAGQTREELSLLQKAMVEEFYQFDLDFPGGTWEELARLLRERLAAAYEQQFPEILKPYLPAKAEFEVSSKTANPARYPAIQAKAVTLALLRSFGPGPVVEGKLESTPRVSDKSSELILDVHKSVGRLVLTDANALKSIEGLQLAFFHLGSKPSLPGADHVVALFEMAWKARGGPLFAKVKYHPETKTLMVQGTSEEIESADKVFATLTGRPARTEVSANPFDSITQTLEKIAELIEKQAADKDK